MSYTHLTRQERFDISHLKGAVSQREIGRRLGRSHTSISRELKRNGPALAWRMGPMPPTKERSAGSLWPGTIGGRSMLPCCGTWSAVCAATGRRGPSVDG
jgi:hypothetical protein